MVKEEEVMSPEIRKCPGTWEQAPSAKVSKIAFKGSIY